MLPRTYEDQNCSIARALEVLGDRWTILVMREAFMRVRRFDDFQRDLGVARNVLSDRLHRLTEEGLLERHRYQERPERFEYRLTEKGLDLWPVMIALMQWGDRYEQQPEGRPSISRSIVSSKRMAARIRSPLNAGLVMMRVRISWTTRNISSSLE